MNLLECQTYINQRRHLVGRQIDFKNREYELIKFIAIPVSRLTLVASIYASEPDKAFKRNWGNEDLEVYAICEDLSADEERYRFFQQTFPEGRIDHETHVF